MLNKIIIEGRVTKDPEIRTIGEHSVANFSVACERDFAGKDKEKQTDFFDVAVWGKSATAYIQPYIKKGMTVIVDGSMQFSDYTDKNGVKRRSATIKADNVYSVGNGKRKDSKAEESFAGNEEGFVELPEDDSDVPF